MTRDELLAIYDAVYAAKYDDTFLHGEHYYAATAFELQWLRDHLPRDARWLDVACGTGWFLAQFPDVDRCGLDLAPAMLDHARRCNPGVAFLEADYRDPRPELEGRWDFVTMMWWAYVYAGTIPAIRAMIANLIAWTAPRGSCFVPICDPEELCQTPINNQLGGTEITAVLWNWRDERWGAYHENLIAPHRDYLLRLFTPHFETVEVLDYPRFESDAVGGTRRAIWARGRRVSVVR